MGDQEWQAHSHAKKPVVLRNHNRILELNGGNLLARRVDNVGHPPLRQRPTAASNGHGARSSASPLSQYKSGKCIQGNVITISSTQQSAFSPALFSPPRLRIHWL